MSSRFSWAVRGAASGAFALTLLASSSALVAPDQQGDTPSNDTTGVGMDTDTAPPPTTSATQAPGVNGKQPVAGTQLAPPTPSFLITGMGAVSETFTTNSTGAASSSATTDDFDSRLQLQLNALER